MFMFSLCSGNVTHSPAMHSPHIMHAKAENSSSFTPVTSGTMATNAGPMGVPPQSHVPTPPRPMSTHTPNLQGHPPQSASPLDRNQGNE